MATAKKIKSRKPLTVFYAVKISRWEWRYALHLHHGSLDEPIYEFRHLHVFGEMLSPLLPKVEGVEISLLPDRDMQRLQRVKEPLTLIGSMRLHNGILQVLQGIPADTLPSLLIAFSSGHFQYAHVTGTALRNRQADVTGLSLDPTLDDDFLEAQRGKAG
jgi:hypothetical protein